MATTINPTKPEDVAVEGEKPKRARQVERLPLFDVPEGTKYDVTPDTFDPDTHRLLKTHFKGIPEWKEHQAWVHEKRAAKLRVEAAEYRVNPPARIAGAKKAKLMDRLSKLEAKLAELGVNVSDLFAE
jgi:hypothetical protein